MPPHDARGPMLAWPILLLPLLLTTPAGAAAAPALYSMSLEELGAVQVKVAAKRDESIIDTSGTVYVITEEMIQRYGWRDLREILEALPNLDLEWSHNLLKGGQRGFRGNFNRTLILIDGRKWNNVFSEEFLVTDGIFPANQIKRVEVLQGPNSSLYGTEAMEGVINIITRYGEDGDDTAQGEYLIGEASTRSANVLFRRAGQDFVIGGSASMFSSDRDWPELADFHADTAAYSRSPAMDAFRTTNPAHFLMEGRDQTFDLYGRMQWFHGGLHYKRSYSDASLLHVRENAGAYIADRDQTMFFVGIDYPVTEALQVLFEYHDLNANDRFNANLPVLDDSGTQVLDHELTVTDHFSRNQRFVSQVDYAFPFNNLIAGFEWEQRNTNKFSAADQLRTIDRSLEQEEFGAKGAWEKYTAFVQDTFAPVEYLKITPGINFLHRDFLDDEILLRLNAMFLPTPRTAIKLTYGEGARGPSVFEAAFAEGSLAPQLMDMYELNYSQRFDLGALELLNILAVYRMNAKNIYEQTVSGGSDAGRRTVAGGSARVDGFENMLQLGSEDFSGFLGMRYVQPDPSRVELHSLTDATSTRLETRNTVLDMPQWKLKGGLSMRWHPYFRSSLFFLYWAAHKTKTHDIALSREIIKTIAPQHRVDLNLELGEFQFSKAELAFGLHIKNLFNTRFYHSNPRGNAPVQYLQTPRHVRFKMRMTY